MPGGTHAKAQARVAILGAGAVGSALARGLAAGGYPLLLWSRRKARAASLARSCGADARVAGDLDELGAVRGALLCVRDDALSEVAQRLAAACPRTGARPFALHTSGFHDETLLAPLASAGWSTGTLHPLLSLPRKRSAAGAEAFAGAWFAIAGSTKARRAAREIARALGGRELVLAAGGAARARYHAAASLLAGGLVALFDAALELQADAIPSERAARAAYARLATSVLANLESRAPEDCLTGPVARGDAGVVAGHLKLLKGKTQKQLYRTLAARMLSLAANKGTLTAAERKRIARLLAPSGE